MVVGLVVLFHFVGCGKLSISNLKANYSLKRANGLYKEEQYKNAAKEYEQVLKLNPDMKKVYLYLGTCYSQVYRPMNDEARNKEYGEKAVEYLQKAYEFEPDNQTVIMALADLHDKMGNVEKAEEFYLGLLKKSEDDPKSYYTMANFYSKNNKPEKAEEMYLARIKLDPKDPEGYNFLANYYQDLRKWREAIDCHYKRLYAMLKPDIITKMDEITQLTKDAEDIKKVEDYVALVQKNKQVDAAEKQRLIDESKQKLQGKLSLDATNNKLKALDPEVKALIKRAEASVEALNDEQKLKISDIYYSLGVVCWNWSYQTQDNLMDAKTRDVILEEGLANLNKALKVNPEYAYALSYIGLIYRQKIRVDPVNEAKYVKLNEEYNKKFQDIFLKKKKSEDYKKKLEELGVQE